MPVNFISQSQISRLKELAKGGEATIYDYKNNLVLKVFHPKVDLGKKEKKIKYFLTIKSKFPSNVIGPEDIATLSGNFIGYPMKKLSASEDLHMLTKTKFLAASGFSNKDVLQIITDLGEDLGKIHDTGSIVGDVSDYNFQISGKKNYFIDVDSWGFGKFSPDAYTERFTCPDSYMTDGTIHFSKENEYYNFAVLAFYMLTRIHPFEGTYIPDKTLSTIDRMKKKISVLGKHKKDIKIPKIIGSWKWMSPQLEKDFIDIFENGKKIDITPHLKELLSNMKYCSVHNIYYYGKYNECPICNDNAKVKTAPVVAKATQTSGGPQISVIFTGSDCVYILSDMHYLNQFNEAVHFTSGRNIYVPAGKRVDFSEDGKLVCITDDDTIQIIDENNQTISVIERMYKTNYLLKGNYLYYVDKGNNLVKLFISKKGNMPTYLGQVYNPIFEVSEEGKVLVASIYPKKAVIKTDDYTFEVDYTGRIKEYGIKYDKVSNSWLFIYHLPNGKYRTMVFKENKIVYDDDVIRYNAHTLSNIDFYNNTIYDPSDDKIVGTNLVKNIAKEFNCSVVDENSRLKFTGRVFKIYNPTNIYNYG